MFIKITGESLSLEEAIGQVVSPTCGATVTFIGSVRDSEGGKPIASICYEAYASMAEKTVRGIVESCRELWGARVAIHHRVGEIPVGEAAVVIASAAPHRREAFAACEYAIERIKAVVPIWKVDFKGVETCALK
ncbi:MAG: molybdenum cofactor biosynthesis protein MoaE [Elusimicrobia bacterium]|nr:molybdenum cofactor biosynthesis protein MoaE [Elusimicrobiota bacterium]